MAAVGFSTVADTSTLTTLNEAVVVFTQSLLNDSIHNLTARTVPSDCLVVSMDKMEFIPWDNPDNVVSAEVEGMARRVKDAVILPLLFLIGGPANVINMAVFYKQGLQERVNLCLFALSLADFVYLLQSVLLYGEQLFVGFATKEPYGPMMTLLVNNNWVGLFGFSFVSQVISAIIASERCVCVLSPLRFQSLLKTRTMAAVVVAVFVVVLGLYFLVGARYHLGCVYDLLTHTSKVDFVASDFYLRHQTLINYLDGFVFGTGIPVVVIIVVTTTTTITAMKIRQAARWRAESSAQTISPREVALTKMLIGNSLLFMVCVFPLALFRCVWLFLPEINPGRRHHNLYMTCLWLMEPLSYINASFNIVVYYTMGSRYRATLRAMVCRDRGSNPTGSRLFNILVKY